MHWLLQLANRRLASNNFAVHRAQLACFAAAIALFPVAVLKTCQVATTEYEIVMGLLASIACMLLMIVCGLLLPLASTTTRGST